jgi:hypothetical protein
MTRQEIAECQARRRWATQQSFLHEDDLAPARGIVSAVTLVTPLLLAVGLTVYTRNFWAGFALLVIGEAASWQLVKWITR